ncbi:phage tail tip lysozyme [Methylobacterium sp. J-043]|nr:phage tail tip lysozyme [Methylobacterium sp. J-043]
MAVQSAFLSINVWAAKVSGGFDQLYYSAQRMGASAANIKALSYGLSQMGSNASAANSSMENFARTLRNNRGYYEVLERLGIRTRNAQGLRRDATELMQEFGRALRSQSQEAKHLYLEMFGIDDATGRALIQGVDKFTTEYRDKLRKAGLDPDKAAADANALQTTFRSIGSSLEVLGAKIASRLFNEQNNAFKRFMEFVDTNGDKIAGIVSKLAQVALQLAEAFIKLATDERTQRFLDALLGSLGKVDEKTGEFTADVEKLKTALEVFAAFVVGTWLTKLLGAFGMLGKGWTGLLRTLGLPVIAGLAASGGGHMTPEEYKGALDSDPARRKADEELNSRGGAGKRWWKKNMPTWLGGEPASATSGNSGSTATSGEDIGGTGGGASGALESYNFWRSKGVPHEAAAGLVAMEEGESHFNPRARGDGRRAHGAFQHHPDRRAAIQRALGIDISNGTHLDQLRGAYWEFQGGDAQAARAWKRIMGAKADEAAALGTRHFERPLDKEGEALRRGQRANFWEKQFRGRPAPETDKPQAPRLTADDILPGGLKGAVNGNMPGLMQPSAPPASNSQSSTSITVNQGAISVAGMDDGRRVADRIGEVQGYRTSDLVRNLRRSVA